MAITFLTPDQVAQQYLLHLKGNKPEVNTAQTDTDWWVKAQTVGGTFSGIYADQKKISQDAFPQNARHEALEQHLILYFGSGFNDPTKAQGFAAVTGTNGSTVTQFTEFTYLPTGNTYQATTAVVLSGPTGVVPIQSVGTGQNQNLLSDAALRISTPPPGILQDAKALGEISDGRNGESDPEAAQRVLDRVRFPLAGGTVTDYKQWARDADPSVIEANIIRFIFGPGSVGVVITAGTTDIDSAVNQGIPVVRDPSDALVDKVAAYIDAKNPLTDCAYVFGPQTITVDVTVHVRYKDGNGDTVPSTQLANPDGSMQTLTQRQLVQREVSRAIYKTPPGGRQFGSRGYVVASEIEEVIDLNLSAEPYVEGEISSILVDRDIDDLSASGANLRILPSQIAAPGTINIVEMT